MQLTAANLEIRDSARRFAQERLLPGAARRDRESEFPTEELRELGALGFLGMLVPDQWGGSDVGFLSYILALEEIAAADGACSTIVSVHSSPCCAALLAFGNEDQKARYLPAMASGGTIGIFALTEPHAGSDASAVKCRARRDGDHYILDGSKQFITSGKNGHIAIVFAVTDPDAGKRGLSAFLVETGTPGYEVSAVERKLGQKSSDTCSISLAGLRVPAENLLGGNGNGYRVALANLEGGRIGIAAQSVGMARAAFEFARDYAHERRAFGKPIVEHQAVAFRLADMATRVEAARQLVHHAARLKEAGQPCMREASMAKLFASETAEAVCSNAIQVLGGYGYVSDYPVERIYRDVRVCQIYEGTSDIQRLVIARSLTGQR